MTSSNVNSTPLYSFTKLRKDVFEFSTAIITSFLKYASPFFPVLNSYQCQYPTPFMTSLMSPQRQSFYSHYSTIQTRWLLLPLTVMTVWTSRSVNCVISWLLHWKPGNEQPERLHLSCCNKQDDAGLWCLIGAGFSSIFGTVDNVFFPPSLSSQRDVTLFDSGELDVSVRLI